MSAAPVTHEEWTKEAERRFGKDPLAWRFICPSCGYVASVGDWKAAGAPQEAAGFACVGRYLGSKKELGDTTGGPCNYTTGGLFKLSPVRVVFGEKTLSVFAFASEVAS